ncbi:hypothetical protein BH10CYA1_BH10CYA1_53290 [soil metagenome]
MKSSADDYQNHKKNSSNLGLGSLSYALRSFLTRENVSPSRTKAFLTIVDVAGRMRGKYRISDLFYIGRLATNNLAIRSDRLLSKNHAVIAKIYDSFFIEDLCSRNGTYVNCERISGRSKLRNGDRIFLGRTMLIFYDNTGPLDFSVSDMAGHIKDQTIINGEKLHQPVNIA